MHRICGNKLYIHVREFYWGEGLSTIDLLLTTLFQIIFKLKIMLSFYTKLELYEEVNCAEPYSLIYDTQMAIFKEAVTSI